MEKPVDPTTEEYTQGYINCMKILLNIFSEEHYTKESIIKFLEDNLKLIEIIKCNPKP